MMILIALLRYGRERECRYKCKNLERMKGRCIGLGMQKGVGQRAKASPVRVGQGGAFL